MMENFHTQNIKHVKNVSLIVKNIDVMLNYYEKAIGLKLISKEDNIYKLGTYQNVHLLTLIHEPNALEKRRSTGLYHFALLLPNRNYLGQFIKHVILNRIPAVGGSDHGISEAFYLDDPEGNGIEIYADKPKEKWPPFDQAENLMLDYEDLIKSAANEPFTKIPDGTIMGHIHLYVSSIEKGKKFFLDVLGLKPTMEYGPKAFFVSDHGYHHHVGFNTWQGTGIPNKLDLEVGLTEYEFHIPKNEVTNLIESLKNNNIPYTINYNYIYFKDMNNTNVKAMI